MMRRIFLAAAVAASATGAAAIDFSDGPVFARCVPYGDLVPRLTICEVAFPPGTDYRDYMCAALDADGETIAADYAPTIGFLGLSLNDLDPTSVADVKCWPREEATPARP